MLLLLRSTIRPLFVAAAAAVALLVVTAPAALAHDALLASDPAAGASVAVLPGQVRLTFSEEPRVEFSAVHVTGPDGVRYDGGSVTKDGVALVQPLTRRGPAGTYTVDWRVVSGDGHPLTGQLTVTATSGSAPTTAPAAIEAVDEQAEGDHHNAGRNPGVIIGFGVAAVVLVGGVVGVTLRRRPPSGHE